MFSICILFVRENGFVYVTLKWFIGNIGREIKERFVTLKKVEASIERKRERKSGPHLSTAMWAPPMGQSCGAHHEQYEHCGPTREQSFVGPSLTSIRARFEQYADPI